MDKLLIGVIDSNTSAVEKLAKDFPYIDFLVSLYTHTITEENRSELTKAMKATVAELTQKNTEIIICLDPLLSQYLPKEGDIPLISVFSTGLQEACSLTHGRIGVLSSKSALKVGGYGKLARNIRPTVVVTGWYLENINKPTREDIDEAVEVFSRDHVDCVLISACLQRDLVDYLSEKMPEVHIVRQWETLNKTLKSTLAVKGMMVFHNKGSVNTLS